MFLLGSKYFIKDHLDNNEIKSIRIVEINDVELIFEDLDLLHKDRFFYRELDQISKISDIDIRLFFEDKVYSAKSDLIKAIISRDELVSFSKSNFIDLEVDSNTVLISITDPNSKPLDRSIISFFKDSLELSFHDIEEPIPDHILISHQQGLLLKNFINLHKSDNFVIHCEAGISRSSGVGMAVLLGVLFNWDKYSFSISNVPNLIKEHPRYHINYTVFDIIADS